MDADVHCPFKLPECPGRTGYSSELANAMVQSPSWRMNRPFGEMPQRRECWSSGNFLSSFESIRGSDETQSLPMRPSICLWCAYRSGLHSMIGWRMWISFEPPVPRYFVSYNVSEVVQPIRCERCKAEGKPVRILILIIIVSLVLTLAISNSALRPLKRSAKGAWIPTLTVHSNSQTVLNELGIHWSLRIWCFGGVRVGVRTPFGTRTQAGG